MSFVFDAPPIKKQASPVVIKLLREATRAYPFGEHTLYVVLGTKRCTVRRRTIPPIAKDHVLPRDKADLNIVEPLRERFRAALKAKGWSLHRFFHHLSSSQALAFNVFLPIYPAVPSSFVETRRVLGLREKSIDVDFEVVLPNGDGTNIDVVLQDGSNGVVVEVKLTEAGFGRAARDQSHLDRLRSCYVPILRGRLADELLEPNVFFQNYQLLRQLAQLRPASADRALLLLPRERTGLWAHAHAWCAQAALGGRSRDESVLLRSKI